VAAILNPALEFGGLLTRPPCDNFDNESYPKAQRLTAVFRTVAGVTNISQVRITFGLGFLGRTCGEFDLTRLHCIRDRD
jgi:hypothetical protein